MKIICSIIHLILYLLQIIILVIIAVIILIVISLCIYELHEALFAAGIMLSYIQDLKAKTRFVFIDAATRNIKSKSIC